MSATDIGIDLGTANVIITLGNKGIVVNEPSVVAYDKKKHCVLAVGNEAYKMIGRTPEYIVAVKPLKDGVISDNEMTEAMIIEFIRKVIGRIVKPRIILCVPSSVTDVENRAVVEAALCAGALVGCGANSNSANAATSGAQDTVTLAVVSPVTGDSAEYGIHFNVGAQMAADKINEAGGINGKQVVLKSFDSKNDAKEAAEVARLICQDKTILATMEELRSAADQAEAKIPEEELPYPTYDALLFSV